MIWAILMGELTFMLGGETSMGTVYTWAVAHQQCITGPSNLHATKHSLEHAAPHTDIAVGTLLIIYDQLLVDPH